MGTGPRRLHPTRHAVAIAAAASGLAWLAIAASATDGTGDDPALSGRDIYARVLANRFDAFTQKVSMVSGERSGRIQETRLEIQFKDFRGPDGAATRGVVSKTLVKYTHPFDLRYAGYLVIQNHARANDQFLYFPARHQVRRVSLRGEAVFGTDFSFEDILPRELEDATYHRADDVTFGTESVYVVDAIPTEIYDSEYSKLRFYIDKERFVPLRTRYWDKAPVEIKELLAERGSIERFDDIWVPLHLTMRHLLNDSYTTLHIGRLVANPDLPETTFELRRLESH